MLRQAAEDYLALRRSLGFKLIDTGELLASFVVFAGERGELFVRAETATTWANSSRAAASRCHHRLRTMALFAAHLHTEDPRHELIPTAHLPSARRLRHPPRIFTAQEIERVLALTGSLWPSYSVRPLTYRTLIGLLFTTGMRIGEALRLRLEDVDSVGLTIRQTKFGKSRWLPLHASTREALERYLVARRALMAESDSLFLSWRRRHPLGQDYVLTTFQALCSEAGIGGSGGSRKPRLHDLRHSFATHALRRCGADRDAVEKHMLALSTYLGHVSISSTYWYLEQTPELMRDIADACDNAYAGADT